MQSESSSSVRVFYPRHSQAELIAELRGRMPDLAAALPLRQVVLFGSWATGTATAFSDIDLLVIYEGPAREDAYKTARRAVPMRGLEPHVYTKDEAAALAGTLEKMTEESVLLFGQAGPD